MCLTINYLFFIFLYCKYGLKYYVLDYDITFKINPSGNIFIVFPVLRNIKDYNNDTSILCISFLLNISKILNYLFYINFFKLFYFFMPNPLSQLFLFHCPLICILYLALLKGELSVQHIWTFPNFHNLFLYTPLYPL